MTRKITRSLTRIKLNLEDKLYLGNLDALRDWGHARDYVELQWLILQQDTPDDWVIATGEQYSVRDFVNEVASQLDMKLIWKGKGIEEKAYDSEGKIVVEVDPAYFRPTEVSTLLGDSSKAKKELGWSPKTSFKELVREMTESDLKQAKNELKLQSK